MFLVFVHLPVNVEMDGKDELVTTMSMSAFDLLISAVKMEPFVEIFLDPINVTVLQAIMAYIVLNDLTIVLQLVTKSFAAMDCV